MKRISSLITATNRELTQSSRRFPSRALVLNLNTGEIRKGPGSWADLKPAFDEALADVVVATVVDTNVDISGDLAVGETFNGYELQDGDFLLVLGQSHKSENGIYMLDDGDPVRATDYNTFAAHAGTVVFVGDGDLAGHIYVCSTPSEGTLGSTSIGFETLATSVERETESTPVSSSLAASDKFLVIDASTGSLKKVSLTDLTTALGL